MMFYLHRVDGLTAFIFLTRGFCGHKLLHKKVFFLEQYKVKCGTREGLVNCGTYITGTKDACSKVTGVV